MCGNVCLFTIETIDRKRRFMQFDKKKNHFEESRFLFLLDKIHIWNDEFENRWSIDYKNS